MNKKIQSDLRQLNISKHSFLHLLQLVFWLVCGLLMVLVYNLF